MGRIRRRYNVGFRIKRAVEAVQRPAVGEIAKINAVSGVMIPTENCFVCKLDLGIGACRLRGIDRLDMYPILGRVGVRVVRQAHVLSVQREKRRVDAEIALRQANVDRTQPKVAEACHHDVLLRVRRKLFLHFTGNRLKGRQRGSGAAGDGDSLARICAPRHGQFFRTAVFRSQLERLIQHIGAAAQIDRCGQLCRAVLTKIVAHSLQ